MTLGSFGELKPFALAASAKSKKEANQPVVQPPAADRPVPPTRPKFIAKKSARGESDKSLAPELPEQTPSDRAPGKIRRHQKAGKKFRPPAVVQPKPNLSYHGILEQPQRYTLAGTGEQVGCPTPRRVSCCTTTSKNSTRTMTG
jgi:hypothetical protein